MGATAIPFPQPEPVIPRPRDRLGRTRSAASTAFQAVPLLRSAEEDRRTAVVALILRLRRRGTSRRLVEGARLTAGRDDTVAESRGFSRVWFS